MKRLVIFLIACCCFFSATNVLAEPGIDVITSTTNKDGSQTYTVTIKILFLMTAMVFIPAAVMLMTSFARIVIVLSILRQALGTPQTPSSQIIIGLSLFLTFFIMSPVLTKVYDDALKPYLDEKMNATTALDNAKGPFRKFMLSQTRKNDLETFLRISKTPPPKSLAEVPFSVLVPSFITSELKTAFQIGFLLFIPFIVIDIVVASVLMSMGMMMLSPMLVALPFKIMLFVLVDGWTLVVSTLARSFAV